MILTVELNRYHGDCLTTTLLSNMVVHQQAIREAVVPRKIVMILMRLNQEVLTVIALRSMVVITGIFRSSQR